MVGLCRQLGPALEAAVRARGGDVELAKVDVDSNQMLAQAFGIQGIPAVKAFRDAKLANEFTGAVPPARIEQFLDTLMPSRGRQARSERRRGVAPRRAGEGPAARLRGGWPRSPPDLARRRRRGPEPPGGSREVGLRCRRAPGPGRARGSARRERRRLRRRAPRVRRLGRGRSGAALELLQAQIAAGGRSDRRDLLRRVMVAIFTELGPDHPLAAEHRRRLAAALN